ncbi:protocatechuate-dioxygenase subunit beta [Mytilinidion resinicola]|uniref:Protocatechuate-dioxygenase subunit beta n=1 Tax=Mytilinidion resinicola TaxID=574789 RepID=A0A6A6Y7B8_9PEZI|nr:protocatechuate-dioxygenase subunit beta [Mytilinidion resinicola]KAF2804085.1 protocatechuate-dioxygenase subunit beta [Mytilinidion resinicola]
MGKIVAAVGLSHAPGALAFPETATSEARERTEKATRDLGISLEAAKPDIIFAFLDDHFENFYRNLMPTIAVSVAETHVGPADQWMETLRIPKKTHFPGNPKVAEHLIHSLVEDGFDVARTGTVEYGNNLMMPWVLMRPELENVAIIPIFLNVFTPPLMKYSRAFALGEACRKAALALPDETRVAFMCTGGLSHWPPYWSPTQAGDPPSDPFLALMKKFQTEGKPVLKEHPDLLARLDDYEIEMAKKNEYPLNSKHPLVNWEWDRGFLDKFCAGDGKWLSELTYAEVEEEAGHGGHEVLNWVALSGAMNSSKAKMLLYEPVVEWICGMAYVDFEVGKTTNGATNGTNGAH